MTTALKTSLKKWICLLSNFIASIWTYPASKLSRALWRRGGKRKESLQLRLWNLNICIGKIEAKCWLAEMTIVVTSLPLACVFNVCLHSRSFPFHADWRKSDSTVDEEPQGNWRWNWNSTDVVASSLPFPAPPPERPGELARRLICARWICQI